MISNGLKIFAIMVCIAAGSLATPDTAKADLAADSSFGFNYAGQTYVGGWVSNVGIFNYSQNQGRRVQLWFWYPSTDTYHMVMDQQLIDIPAKQTRAFLVPINPYSVQEQPLPYLHVTPAITDIDRSNDTTIDTVWLGSH